MRCPVLADACAAQCPVLTRRMRVPGCVFHRAARTTGPAFTQLAPAGSAIFTPPLQIFRGPQLFVPQRQRKARGSSTAAIGLRGARKTEAWTVVEVAAGVLSPYVMSGSCLRACYALSGTDAVYRTEVSGTDESCRAVPDGGSIIVESLCMPVWPKTGISLRACYAKPGTDLGYCARACAGAERGGEGVEFVRVL
eukprot:803295-Rhodomonas_salina.2